MSVAAVHSVHGPSEVEYVVRQDAIVGWSRRFKHVVSVEARSFAKFPNRRVMRCNGGWTLWDGGNYCGVIPREAVRGCDTSTPSIEWTVWWDKSDTSVATRVAATALSSAVGSPCAHIAGTAIVAVVVLAIIIAGMLMELRIA